MVSKKEELVSVVIVTRNRKQDALICIQSIFSQSYKNLQVILVDNASLDDTAEVAVKKFPTIIVVKSLLNTGGAGGRNLGIPKAKGEFVLFMDDDARADKEMIKELVNVMSSDPKIGIVQPKIYELERKNMIQGVGHGINLLTGRVYGIGVHVEDKGQFEEVLEIPMAGCTWMVRRSIFNKIGTYDEDYFIPYEDSDFSHRVKLSKDKVLFVPLAKVWHRGPKKTFIHPWIEWIGITTPERAYRVSRNKIIFMRKHAPLMNFLVFLLVFIPIYTFLHSVIMIFTKRIDLLVSYWRGLLAGFGYILLKLPRI